MAKPRAYFNEIDPFAAQWLRELIAAGHIAPGDVDTRSIEDVTPDDLRNYTQCHFFAGIGVWSYALRCAGWPDDRPVWTGSCPCQPFSAAGKGGGFADERHLWPAFHHLIRECGPPVVLGEQVASKDGLAWLDLVQADLEGTGYASAAVDLCAAGVGAPHIRQRLYWLGERMADADDTRPEGCWPGIRQLAGNAGPLGEARPDSRSGAPGGLADAKHDEQRQQRQRVGEASGTCESGVEERERLRVDPTDGGSINWMDDDPRLEGHRSGHRPEVGHGQGPVRSAAETGQSGGIADNQRQQQSGSSTGGNVSRRWDEEPAAAAGLRRNSRPGPTNGFWRDADWLFCRDGKWRPVEPGTFPLVDGAPARVGRLRGYGNAIVAPAAQAFIEAYLEARAEPVRLTDVSAMTTDKPAPDIFS